MSIPSDVGLIPCNAALTKAGCEGVKQRLSRVWAGFLEAILEHERFQNAV